MCAEGQLATCARCQIRVSEIVTLCRRLGESRRGEGASGARAKEVKGARVIWIEIGDKVRPKDGF